MLDSIDLKAHGWFCGITSSLIIFPFYGVDPLFQEWPDEGWVEPIAIG